MPSRADMDELHTAKILELRGGVHVEVAHEVEHLISFLDY